MTSGVSLPPVDKVRDAHRRLEAVVAELSDADLRAPSALPGWTRGHVIAHLADNARAVARQLDTAREGKLVDLYDGGPEGRDAVIASNATLRAGVLQAVLAQRNAELDEAMSDYGDEDWGRRARHLGGQAAAVVWARWREVEIHLVDMSVGASADEWDEPLATHLLDFLRGRVPAEVTMAATDVARQWPGAGPADGDAPRTLAGPVRDLALWAAGRDCYGPLEGTPPELGPWPNPQSPPPPPA